MLCRFSPLLRAAPLPPPSSTAARVISCVLPSIAALPSRLSHPPPHRRFFALASYSEVASISGRRILVSGSGSRIARFGGRNGGVVAAAGRREYRKVRTRRVAAAKKSKKELELSVNICLDEQLPENPEIMDITEIMRLNVPMAMKLAFERLNDSEYTTRDTVITDVGCYESVELSVLFCNDEFIQKLNKDWRGEDHATDVLSMSQHILELKLPILMLGDIVISVETAARQAEERGHTLIDEIRILMVHGLLHLLGFDHELSDEAEKEMENEEELMLKGLGWKGKEHWKGLIHSAYDAEAYGGPCTYPSDEKNHISELSKDRKRAGSLRFYKPKFGYIFCDMDGGVQGYVGENGSISGKACPKGLYGIFCEECPIGTYKNVTGSEKSLRFPCPADELPNRAAYVHVRGVYLDRYHMPNCYTALEELIYTFGGPWLFGLLLLGLLVLLALVLSVARMKFIGVDELLGPAPTQQGSQIDHSFPFLESLNEVLETNRVEESQSHVHRMYFMGPSTFSEAWYLLHTPPEQVKEIVYEGAFNPFVDEINALAAYQWWEGAVHSIFCILAYPFAWSWQQWRRRMKLQKIREFVRSEYDHACLHSCRSRALYEGLKVAATPDLMLAYIDFFLGGDEKRTDLPPRLQQRFPMSLLFGGDGSYMTPFILHNDNIITSLMSQSVPPTTWGRFVAGVNAQLHLVRRGCLRSNFRSVLQWLDTFANPELRVYDVDLAWFQATTDGDYHYGLLIYSVEEFDRVSFVYHDGEPGDDEQHSRAVGIHLKNESSNKSFLGRTQRSAESNLRGKIYGGVLDFNSLKVLEEKRDLLFILSFLIHNTEPVGHQDLVGLVISILLLGDSSLVLLTLLQLYSLSLAYVFLVLFIMPLGILLPFPAGINALFSHGPKRSAGLARVYALWNITSFINIGVAFICGYIHYRTQSSKTAPNFQPWNMDESEWWIFPLALLLCKCIQSKLVNWHVANLEIQDRALYSNDFDLFWHS